MIDIIYEDDSILVCVKPFRVLSTDEPGGMPELVRRTLGDENACVRTVHRLDRVVGGLMVLCRSPEAASLLSRQIMDRSFRKEYLAVVHGLPESESGSMTDLLRRDKAERKTYVADRPEKGVQEAVLNYRLVRHVQGLSLVSIELCTGRTHQIRAQFSSRGMPLVGDRKYSELDDPCEIALWSSRLAFAHPITGEAMDFRLAPPEQYPWSLFEKELGI